MSLKSEASVKNGDDLMWRKAYDKIRKKIFDRELKPGQSVSELKLSRELGISRTPIREALNKLELDGLVVTENRRKKINIISIHEINEIFELKKAIESHMARLAARNASEQDLKRFRSMLDRLRDFAERDLSGGSGHEEDMRTWTQIDEDFHSHIFNMAGNQRAAQFVGSLNNQWHRIRMGLLAMEGRLKINVHEHIAMGEALLAREDERVAALMTEHLDKLQKTLTNIMEAFQIPF